ncbi:hypothetical protein ACLI4Z_07605 [Natrialbaceae archaeon A-arb3/5]
MIDDALLSAETLGGDEFPITPQPEHLVPNSLAHEQTRSWFRDELESEPGSVILTRDDTDGYSSAALLVDDIGADTVILPLNPDGAYNFTYALEDLHATGIKDTPIYVAGITLESDEHAGHLEYLTRACDCAVTWYDTARWDDEVVDAFEANGVDLVLDSDECAASLIEREREHEYDENLREIADLAADLTLERHDDARSDRLAAFQTMADTALFIRTVRIHGVDFPPKINEEVDAQLEHERHLEADAVDAADETIVGDYDVAIAYTRADRRKRIGSALLNEHDNDLAVVLGTDANMGIYSHSDRETIAKCDEIAAEFGGGGRPTAAECSVPVETFRELAAYWSTTGESITDDLVAAIETVVDSSS